MIICISGFACNGKTTIVDKLEKYVFMEIPYNKRNKILFVKNIFRNCFTNYLPYVDFDMSDDKAEVVTNCVSLVLYKYLSLSTDLIISDRSPVDHLCFGIIRGIIDLGKAKKFIYDFKLFNKIDKIYLLPKVEDKYFIEKNCLFDKDRKDTLYSLNEFLKMQDEYYKLFNELVGEVCSNLVVVNSNSIDKLVEEIFEKVKQDIMAYFLFY